MDLISQPLFTRCLGATAGVSGPIPDSGAGGYSDGAGSEAAG